MSVKHRERLEKLKQNSLNDSKSKTKNSRFVVNYRHYFRDETFVYLVTDLCEETLKDHVLSRSIDDLKKKGRRMIKEILTGLQFLHDQGILHRDLKPSNVLVDIGGHMRLADFGITCFEGRRNSVYTNAKGTPGWMPAEIIEAIGQKVESRYKKSLIFKLLE
ncbi:serine/threonine-protein kinase ppk33-like [Dendronephthya gigantea]|uniref:serine/threonine-protein kinase ppk33-like n=1 Tax=Dendronephthya gigantea TaxID=151771 RepID=UPI00106A9A6C|nr:serine/threonine-protein kinase ppk33-like [Dendronephthya gigantea]